MAWPAGLRTTLPDAPDDSNGRITLWINHTKSSERSTAGMVPIFMLGTFLAAYFAPDVGHTASAGCLFFVGLLIAGVLRTLRVS